jgi:hypothetical protein
MSGSPSEFHGFYFGWYLPTEKMMKLPLSEFQSATFSNLIANGLDEICYEEYWYSFVCILRTPAPQGYIAWNGKTYWVALFPQIDSEHRCIKETFGLHILEFSTNLIRHRFEKISYDLDRDFGMPHPVENLARTPQDLLLYDWGSEMLLPITEHDSFTMNQNIEWVDKMDQEMYAKSGMPS